MSMKGVTLRGLEVFDALAESGSVANAAHTTGLSQPAVSQQLRNLETALGTELVDHGKRPMVLSPAGRSFLVRARTALRELRLAQSELAVMDLTHLSTLNMGIIDDFDNDLTPRLVGILADSLTKCRFKLITAPSHEISSAMKDRRLHVAILASMGEVIDGVTEYPLIRDPFVLVAPAGVVPEGADVMQPLKHLPLLRYDREQLIGRQIEAHLTRLDLQFQERFEIGSHPSLMSLVGRGAGWAITTPLGYMRARRIHNKLSVHRLPFKAFSRTISLFASADWADTVPRDIAQTVRDLAQDQMINPACDELPWLTDELRIIGA
ncbi:MAG: LysR family transcriptional regulator [Paracoccaceae bacterium]